MMRWCILLVVLGPMLAGAGIELSLSSAQCRPGDVVELRAVSTSDALTTFEMKLPEHEALHLVAHERHPVEYDDGVYRQRDVWVLQAMHSGIIELTGIRAEVHRGGKTSEVALPAQRIEVIPYAAPEDDLKPQPLPEKDGGPSFWWLLLLVPLALVLLILKRKDGGGEASPATGPSMQDLRTALEAGETPRELVERLLAEESHPAGLRRAMERVVYGREPDWRGLRAELGKEGAP